MYLYLFFLQVVGWRLSNEGGMVKLQCLWKLKDYKSGVELINRIFNVVETIGNFPNLHLEPPNQVRAELWTPSLGMQSFYQKLLALLFFEHFESNTICQNDYLSIYSGALTVCGPSHPFSVITYVNSISYQIKSFSNFLLYHGFLNVAY